MTIKTHSFRTSNLTPNTLHIASQLITQGADREKIINNLYRTKSVNMLKLWGRALARLEFDEENKIAWTQITSKDFSVTKTSPDNIKGLLEELITETPMAHIIVLLYEKDNYTYALISTKNHYNALNLTKEFEPTGNRNLAKIIFPNKPLIEFQVELLESIKKNLKQRLI